jgi:hypothetical protein
MPVVIIYGVPADTSAEELGKLTSCTQLMVGCTEGLGIEPRDVSVIFPTSMVGKHSSGEIIVFVCGLYEKSQRTPEILHEVAYRVGYRIKNYYFKDSLVEVLIQPVDPRVCWSSKD